jgi:hypothetical protein
LVLEPFEAAFLPEEMIFKLRTSLFLNFSLALLAGLQLSRFRRVQELLYVVDLCKDAFVFVHAIRHDLLPAGIDFHFI